MNETEQANLHTDAPPHTYTAQTAAPPAEGDYVPTGIPGRRARSSYGGCGSRSRGRRSKGCKRACSACGWFRQGRCQAGHRAR